MKTWIKFPLAAESLLGPDSPPSAQTNLQPAWAAFREATRDARDYLQKRRRIPARVYIGPDAVAPADFLAGLAFTFHYYHEHHALPLTNNIPLATHFEILPARQVAQDSPDLFGGWIIHREGFRAPNILAARRSPTTGR